MVRPPLLAADVPQLAVRHLPGRIVALPDEIDLLNASEVGDLLLTVLNRGAAGVIADMTGTRFCDAAGCQAVARAGRRAQLLETWARAVIPHPAVRKTFRLTDADQLISVFATLGDAVPGCTGPQSLIPAPAAGDERSDHHPVARLVGCARLGLPQRPRP
jgi:anti-sigma B factor antagonist